MFYAVGMIAPKTLGSTDVCTQHFNTATGMLLPCIPLTLAQVPSAGLSAGASKERLVGTHGPVRGVNGGRIEQVLLSSEEDDA